MPPAPTERPFVYVTVQGTLLSAMRDQATADIKELLGTEHVTVGCDRAEAVERIDSPSWATTRVALWEAEFRGGFDYAAMVNGTTSEGERA